MKNCRVCKQDKELDQFSVNKNKKDLLNYECKECQKEYFKEYYKNNKTKCIERAKKIKYNQLIIISQLKVEKGCYKCGYNKHSAALHFHHINKNDKKFEISSNIHLPLNLIQEEIEKCKVICANCHAEEHFKDSSKLELKNKKECKKRPEKRSGNSLKRKDYPLPKTSKRISVCPPKEELELLIWQIPTTKIAEKYGVSDKAIEKWCKKYSINKPPRGYWTKNDY
jgi:hypothetical protein